MPRCPVCKVQADLIKYERVPIYDCGGCGGHWLTEAKLGVILARREVVMPAPVQYKMMEIAERAASTGALWCITCGTAMVKEQFKYWPEIQLDRCPKCNGLWLDRGELEKCQIYWEYAQDHPEKWGDAHIVARRALLDAAWANRKADFRELADRGHEFRHGLRGRSLGGMLADLFF